MTKQEYVDLCYSIAKQHGFYDKPENQTVAGNLVHIGSELGEVSEAHRINGVKVNLKNFYKAIEFDDLKKVSMIIFLQAFNHRIKDSFEDELADVLIRSFSMCGHFNLNPEPGYYNEILKLIDNATTIPDKLCLLYEQLFTLRCVQGNGIGNFIQSVEKFCEQAGIDIYKFVDLKIEYNKTRPHLNGKEY